MCVAQVEADAHIEMAHLEHGQQMLGSCCFAQQILYQQPHAERTREGSEMLQGCHSILDAARRPAIGALAEVDDEVLERDALRSFEGALDLIHRVDAPRLFGMEHIDRGRTGAAHLAVREHGRMHRERFERIRTEPGCQLADVLTAGVVEVLSSGEDFDALCAGAPGHLQQARMKTLTQK